MLRFEEFRRGRISLPSPEADEVPQECFSCAYLSYKEFSMNAGEGLFYFYCAYEEGEVPATPPPCLD